MKRTTFIAKTAFVAALLSLAAGLGGPARAQRLRQAIPPTFDPPVTTSEVSFRVAALSDGQGVNIAWRSASEAGVIGYDVFRTDVRGRARINRSMVLGGELRLSEGAAGPMQLSVFDPDGGIGSFYQIERTMSAGYTETVASVVARGVRDLARYTGYSSAQMTEAVRTSGYNPTVSVPRFPKVLSDEIAARLTPANLSMQQWVAAQQGVKIAVKTAGIYRISRSELQTAGFDVTTAAVYWRLFCDGVEQAVKVPADGSYIEFYGRGNDTRETDTKYFYLIGGNVKGKRMASVGARPGAGSSTATFFANSQATKYRTSYLSVLTNGDEENYFGDVISSSPRDTTLNVETPDATRAATLTVKLMGLTTATHTVTVSLNGTQLGTVTGFGLASISSTFNVPSGLLLEGVNTVRYTSTGSFLLTDTATLNYSKRYAATENRLAMFSLLNKQVTVTGFSGSAVSLYDITNPNSPQIVTSARTERSQGGRDYNLVFTTNRQRSLYAVQDGSALSPFAITVNVPSQLSATTNQGDYLIVAHKDFMTQANTWASYRASQGFTSKVVDIEDIFDEFSYGATSTDGITAFFAFAKNSWATKPNYILLIGDATRDFRNYEGAPFSNFVPTRLFDTLFEEASSDDALVDFDNDGLAEIPIGRIPARTTATVSQVYSKMTTYEAGATSGLSARGALFAYDEPNGYNFADLSQRLGARLPAGTSVSYVDRLATNSRTQLLTALNGGKYIVNYSGHGTSAAWFNSTFFASADALAMTNAPNYSLFTMLTCLNGLFTDTFNDGLAESLLKSPNGGAAAAWASTGKTTPDVQDQMANRFYEKFSAGTMPRIGDLVRDSKTIISSGRDVRLSWVLLGDPAMKVR
jgi:hypothetical protein